jgi:hypothetical protein
MRSVREGRLEGGLPCLRARHLEGGSLALQLAVDRPGMLRRPVVAGAVCRLSEHGRAFQR